MPGRTPTEAFDAFIEPIQRALNCLGQGKITPSNGGRQPGATRLWSINGVNGLALRDGWHFDAQMHYEIIRTGDDSGWRVTTRAYRYRLALCGADLFRMHWHPVGNSPYKTPHVHLPKMGIDDKVHLPTGRLTFEDAVEWSIGLGVPPARTDWQSVLKASHALHIEHRTWSTEPPVADELRPGRHGRGTTARSGAMRDTATCSATYRASRLTPGICSDALA